MTRTFGSQGKSRGPSAKALLLIGKWTQARAYENSAPSAAFEEIEYPFCKMRQKNEAQIACHDKTESVWDGAKRSVRTNGPIKRPARRYLVHVNNVVYHLALVVRIRNGDVSGLTRGPYHEAAWRSIREDGLSDLPGGIRIPPLLSNNILTRIHAG